MIDWVFDHAGPVFLVVVVGLIVLVGVLDYKQNKRHDAACQQMLDIAREPSDSIAALQYCHKKSDVVPVFIPIQTGR